MALTIHPPCAERLDPDSLAAWREIPVAIVGDELNRSQIMQAAIRPLGDQPSFAGQALTVQCMVGDNIALHHAVAQAFPGAVIVADARSHEDTAVWGGVLHCGAEARGVAAVVVDGAMRDLAELRASPVPSYCRAVVPAGPHKGFGGEVNGPIQCGGVAVHPGDLVIGDLDGVVVVRSDQLDGLLQRCRDRLAKETAVMEGLKAGKTTVELFGLPGPGEVG